MSLPGHGKFSLENAGLKILIHRGGGGGGIEIINNTREGIVILIQ